MATINQIRKRSGILIIAVFGALLAFLLQDLMGSGGSTFFRDVNEIAKINGVKITRQEMTAEIDRLKGANQQMQQSSQLQLSNFVWQGKLSQILVSEELEKSGMSYSHAELNIDMLNNPGVRQSFTTPDGRVDENSFKLYWKQITDGTIDNEDAIRQWNDFVKGMEDQGMVFKFNNAVEKGIYMPQALAKFDYTLKAKQHPAQYFYLPYVTISDSEISVDESDAKAYYKSHKDEFAQEEGRHIEFINFPLEPSQADRDALRAEMAEIALKWVDIEDDSSFTNLNSDMRFNPNYYTMSELAGTGLDTIVEGNEEGFIYGPIDAGNVMNVVKIAGIKQLPDSTKARHILIAYQGATRAAQDVVRSGQEAQVLADSLMNYIKENPAAFTEVSDQYNNDIVAKGKGGDLGFFAPGTMAMQFNNFCFYNKTGKIGIVLTEFGFHIVEITDQKGANTAYKLAQVMREVLPSEATIQELYNNASQYAGQAQKSEDYRALAAEKGYTLNPGRNLQQLDENIPGLGTARKVVRWAWNEDREEGNIGLLENDGKGYVVVVLTDILEEGTAPFEKVAVQCEFGAKKEARKAVLVERVEAALAANTDITSTATSLGADVKSLSFTVNQGSIPGVGAEANVVGIICGMPEAQLSSVIEGQNGVFVVIKSPGQEAADKGNYEADADNLAQAMRNLVATQLFKSLEDKAEITDKRHLMY